MSVTTTVKKVQETKIKEKDRQLKECFKSEDLDKILHKVKKIDNTCCFKGCKKKTEDFAITCKYCNARFCTTHGLPEVHGCGERAKRDERQKFLHPGGEKLSKVKHEKAADKLSIKIKQMELERKSKPVVKKDKRK